jgi:hypothetical protein
VLAVSGTENLLPSGQVVADRVIATVAEFFLLHRKPAAGCHFAIDLPASHPPYRVGDGVAPAPTVRFFGPGDAAMVVERLVQRTTQTGGVPPELNLVGEFHASMVLDVLQHLSRHWGANPPSFRAAPTRVSTLTVAHGFDDVWRHLCRAAPLSWTRSPKAGRWRTSSGGFGATLPRATATG